MKSAGHVEPKVFALAASFSSISALQKLGSNLFAVSGDLDASADDLVIPQTLLQRRHISNASSDAYNASVFAVWVDIAGLIKGFVDRIIQADGAVKEVEPAVVDVNAVEEGWCSRCCSCCLPNPDRVICLAAIACFVGSQEDGRRCVEASRADEASNVCFGIDLGAETSRMGSVMDATYTRHAGSWSSIILSSGSWSSLLRISRISVSKTVLS